MRPPETVDLSYLDLLLFLCLSFGTSLFPVTSVCCGSCCGIELQQRCYIQGSLYIAFSAIRHCVMNCWPPSLGASLLAVCATACHPLPVCLDLHCAPGEAVGVKQHVTRLCLDLLPVVSTGGRCAHKETFKYIIYIHTNNNNNLQLTNKQLMIIRAGDANRLALWLAAHWTPFKLWWRNYASRIILSTVCTTYWTGGVFFSQIHSAVLPWGQMQEISQ